MSYVKANVLNSTTLFSLLCDDHKDKKAVFYAELVIILEKLLVEDVWTTKETLGLSAR